MKNNSGVRDGVKLRANISIATKVVPPRTTNSGLGLAKCILQHNANLPVEATYEFENAKVLSSTIEVYLFFGNNELNSDNVSLGQIILKDFPYANFTAQVKTKIHIGSNQLLRLSILDPLNNGYLNVGFVDLSKVATPPIKPKPSGTAPFGFGNFINEIFTLSKMGGMPRTGRDISQNLELTFEEAVIGAQKNIDVLRAEKCTACSGSGLTPGTSPIPCSDCQGTGWVKTKKDGKLSTATTCDRCKGTGRVITSPCAICNGQTWVLNRRPLTLNIPPCIDSEARICFPGQGEPGVNGGSSGNLYIDVLVSKHELFTRTGRDVSIRLPVSVTFAESGGQLLVPGADGDGYHILNLPPKTKRNAIFQVYETEAYTLRAVVEIYNPKNPFAVFPVKRQLQAIKNLLKNKDFEVGAGMF